MKIAMYVLCVLKFKDGRIVFTKPELTSINVAIGADLQNQYLLAGGRQNIESRNGFKVYRLDSEKVKTRVSEEVYRLDPEKAAWVNENVKIKSAEVGYYHHRVIVEFILDSAGDFSELREIRALLKKWADETIKCSVQDQINKLVFSQQLKLKARVEFFYTYPLIVVKKRRKRSGTFPFSEETGSSCFDIVEPAFFHPSGKRHMMRVSIPSAILYHGGIRISKNLLKDIVNAIYQYCLYEQKSIAKKPFENVLDENLLARFWEQIFNRLGSRTMEVHISRLTFATVILTVMLVALTVILIVLTVHLSKIYNLPSVPSIPR